LLKAAADFKASKGAFVYIDTASVFVFDGAAGQVNRGDATAWQLKTHVTTPSYMDVIPVSVNSYILRAVDKANQNVLVKQSAKDTALLVNKHLLTKQVDGFFCTDGMLVPVPGTGRFFYVYYYRNQFIAADTNLNLLYTCRTIDTNSVAKIKIGKIKSTHQTTLAGPPPFVNKQASANPQYLFIRSALRADNETKEMHEKTTPIDVYAVKDGSYRFSFYLPDIAGRKLTEFKVYNQLPVALYGQYVYSFKLNF